MAIDEDGRSELEELDELEARVYSRAGADEPRVERVDPVTGRSISVTESEWRLLQVRRARVGATGARERIEPPGGDAGVAEGRAAGRPAGRAAGNEAAPDPPGAARPRPRPGRVTAGVAGMLLGGAIVAGWAVLAEPGPRGATVEAVITPTVAPELAEADGLPAGDAYAVFRDFGLRGGTLPAGLDQFFPAEQVARLLRQSGPIRGADVYAAVSRNSLACLIVRLDPNGIVANCRSVERVRSGGMTLRAAIPSEIGSGRDPDGDGVAGDATRTDLLEVRWRTDGTFLVVRNPD
ncbi:MULTISPECIES: hypothetical protein [unclassified Agromyces]|uniref:hypothetical protein n=1 Tax=unclassified Agromyces TaxID=2639701 RepID=UPI0030154DC9